MKSRIPVILCATIFACLMSNMASGKPKQTTKYVYYSIHGDTPASIYSNLVSRGPRVDGIKAYAATVAVSSQGGKMYQGKFCEIENYAFNIDFTIKLPKLKNENALKGSTKTLWRNFSTFLKNHEETHRSIWLACGSALEAKVHAIKAKTCTEFDAKTVKLWNEIRASCTKKQDAFDAAEQKRLLRQPFVVNVQGQRSKTSSALKVVKKK